MNVLILDMDGTVRVKRGGIPGQLESGFISSPDDQEIIKGAKNAIAYYAQNGWLIIGASNQGGVAAGKKTMDSCAEEQHNTLILEPHIHKILFCPDYEGQKLGVVYRSGWTLQEHEGYSSFRKPSPGMLEYILRTHDCDEILFVGDRPEDEQAANTAGVSFQWAKDWWR